MLTFRAGCLVILIQMVFISLSGVFPQSALDLGHRRMQRGVYCAADQYRHDNMCCLNCQAGTHVKSHCTSSGEMGRCEECDHGLYMEHASGLDQCFKCTQCHSDQEIVRPCNSTQDTVCQCKQGRFCVPDQACEVCKKCSRCDKDEEMVRNCTSTSNTECKKIQPPSTSVRALVVPPVVFAVGLISLTIGCVWKKSKATGQEVQMMARGFHGIYRNKPWLPETSA